MIATIIWSGNNNIPKRQIIGVRDGIVSLEELGRIAIDYGTMDTLIGLTPLEGNNALETCFGNRFTMEQVKKL